MDDIAKRIRERREALHMTQEELASKLGYRSRSSINKIEQEARGLPQKKIVKIAEALHVSVAYLMGWEELQPEETILTSAQYELLEKFGKLDKARQAQIMEQIDFYLWQDENSAKKDVQNLG